MTTRSLPEHDCKALGVVVGVRGSIPIGFMHSCGDLVVAVGQGRVPVPDATTAPMVGPVHRAAGAIRAPHRRLECSYHPSHVPVPLRRPGPGPGPDFPSTEQRFYR
jgi:hypothetical protein